MRRQLRVILAAAVVSLMVSSAACSGAEDTATPESSVPTGSPELIAEADDVATAVLEGLAVGDSTIVDQTAGAVSIAVNYALVLDGIQAKPPGLFSYSDSATVDLAIDDVVVEDDLVRAQGAGQVQRTFADGQVVVDQVSDLVFRRTAAGLALDDYTLDGKRMSSMYVSHPDAAGTVGDVDIRLIGGYRDPTEGFVEYVLTLTNLGVTEVAIDTEPAPQLLAVGGTSHPVDGASDRATSGGFAGAVFQIPGPGAPTGGGDLEFYLSDVGQRVPVRFQVPGFPDPTG